MITNTPSIGPGQVPGPDPRRPRPAASSPQAPAAEDRLSAGGAAGIRESLSSTPAVRTEEVERARALAIDPNYPPLQIIERVARLLAASQDPSETKD